MSTRIAYNSSNGIGIKTAEFMQSVQEMLARGRRLKAVLDSTSSGSDWSAVEAEIGGMEAGTGQAFWTIIATAMASLDSPQVKELSRLDKG